MYMESHRLQQRALNSLSQVNYFFPKPMTFVYLIITPSDTGTGTLSL